MKRIWEKLHNRSGASMVFAILVFMLCVLAATGAMSAAAANAGRYTHLGAEQQAYLSVASAIRLLKDEIAGAPGEEFPVEVEEVNNPTSGKSYLSRPASISGFKGVFCDFFAQKYLDRLQTPTPPTPSTTNLGNYTLTLTVDGVEDKSKVEVKDVEINDTTFDITMTFTLATYKVKVTFPATTTDETVSVTTGATAADPTITVRRGTVLWNEDNVVVMGMEATT